MTFLASLASQLERSIRVDPLADFREVCNMPARESVTRILDQLLAVLFPGAFGGQAVGEKSLGAFLRKSLNSIRKNLSAYTPLADALLEKLPEIRKMLDKDLQAAYDGDPAATSVAEVLLSYPFVQAIATHRLAHELYLMQVPFLPRMFNEVAHSRTGIDIHPGARIGPGFFIDHGTGTVVGETSIIGKNVKMYHGVTLGAKSTSGGQSLRGKKRHPTIEDDVTIYPGATILGGQTVIGKGSTIGGNSWVTASVPPHTLVLSDRNSAKPRQ